MSKHLKEDIVSKDYFKDLEAFKYHVEQAKILQKRLFSQEADVTRYKALEEKGLDEATKPFITHENQLK